jgi:hypothetical protein
MHKIQVKITVKICMLLMGYPGKYDLGAIGDYCLRYIRLHTECQKANSQVSFTKQSRVGFNELYISLNQINRFFEIFPSLLF